MDNWICERFPGDGHGPVYRTYGLCAGHLGGAGAAGRGGEARWSGKRASVFHLQGGPRSHGPAQDALRPRYQRSGPNPAGEPLSYLNWLVTFVQFIYSILIKFSFVVLQL